MSSLRNFGKKTNIILFALVGAFALVGCGKGKGAKDASSSGSVTGEYDYNDPKKGGIGLGLLERVHFDFDRSEINSEAVEILKKNAATIKASKSMRVLVEGHCDERGTNEYNVALGERRAKMALNYLVSLGVARNRLEMKSWGEERPLSRGSGENAWTQNRRAEFVILAK